jgi:hypothetical protein
MFQITAADHNKINVTFQVSVLIQREPVFGKATRPICALPEVKIIVAYPGNATRNQWVLGLIDQFYWLLCLQLQIQLLSSPA